VPSRPEKLGAPARSAAPVLTAGTQTRRHRPVVALGRSLPGDRWHNLAIFPNSALPLPLLCGPARTFDLVQGIRACRRVVGARWTIPCLPCPGPPSNRSSVKSLRPPPTTVQH